MMYITTIFTSFINFLEQVWAKIVAITITYIVDPILVPIGKFFAWLYNYVQTTPFFALNVFNFILVAIFFIWLLFFKLDVLGIFAKKRDEIIKVIRDSEKQKEEAITHFEQTKEALKNVDNDVKNIVSDAKEVAENLKEKSKLKLQEELNNLEVRTQVLKEAHESKAKDKVSKVVTNAAIAVSKEYIENSLDENMHKELIYNFINDLDDMRIE